MQLFRCHTCLPAITCGVSWSSLVSSANCVWLWIVSAMQITVKMPVPAAKNMRVCRLVMATSERSRRSHADPREVADGDPGRVTGRDDNHRQDDDAQHPGEGVGPSSQ